MTWFYYSELAAFFDASTSALSKKALEDSDVYTVAWVRYGYALPFLLCMLLFIEIPPLDSTFFLVTIVLIPLEILALILRIRAIKHSPLSLTLPFLSLTPVFLIGTSYFMLGEKPDESGLIGILLIALGAYLLNVRSTREGLLGPLRAIYNEEGSLLMIAVAFIYSITSNLGKIAILHSGPVFFAAAYPAVIALALFPLMMMMKPANGFKNAASRPFLFATIGVSNLLMFVTHNLAIQLIEVPYMLSVKRTSLIFGVLYGWLLFRETNVRERLLGGVVMLIGVAFIVVF
ncbi:MAG: DMT family transporter [Candidatus Brocadiales bacterium]|nr:DMT family transporter [Candidatus Bathyanammoxibius amoris]